MAQVSERASADARSAEAASIPGGIEALEQRGFFVQV